MNFTNMTDTILVSNVENNYCFSQRINEITVYQRPYIRTILNKLSEISQDNANLSAIILSMNKIHLILRNQPKKEK